MSKLDHPNIVKMIDWCEDKDNYYIILEYMKGGELFERIIEKEIFTEREAIKVL